MTKFLTTKAHGFSLGLATIQHGSHPVALSLHDHTTCIQHTMTQKLRNGKQRALTTINPQIWTPNRKCHPHLWVNACNISNDSAFMGKRALLDDLKSE